jgi:hypothetical protein
MNAGAYMQMLEKTGHFCAAFAATIASGAPLLCASDKAWNGPPNSALL